MKINTKIFSLPPYISTSWINIAALHMKESTLIVNMIDGETVELPDLKAEILELIFDSHAKFMEEENSGNSSAEGQTFGVFPFQSQDGSGEGEMGLPLKFGVGAMEAWGAALQHNPSQAGMPDLPDEVLSKVRSIAKIIAPDDPMAMPKPEPHCNCMHCQIARAISQGLGQNDMYESQEEPQSSSQDIEVNEEDLHFQQWDIHQTEDKLYTVVNRLDSDEKYSVYLGHPVGCTCGKEGCEHILAVLKS